MTKELQTLEAAKGLAGSGENWADLSNALFDPENGIIARAYPSRKDREDFLKTNEYLAIRKLIDAEQQRTGLVAGATPTEKSGKFVVRLPKSLHAALDAEADDEGVSLNQLVVTKLAMQMSRLANSSMPEMALIAQSYLEVRDGYSTDRVVADPHMDRRFLNRCRELGITGTDFDLNWKLFNGRKNKYFTNLPKTRNYTASRKDEFEFSSEIAVRYVQDQFRSRTGRDVSLDKIICDPELAAEFDEIAQRIAPGFEPLDYRWVAFGVRKAAGRFASKASAVDVPTFDFVGSTLSIRASQLPTEQGVYWFRSDDDSLFIGDTDNIRERVERHFDTSAQNGLPDWLCGKRTIELGVLPMPKVTSSNRKIVELGAVREHRPCFNYLGGRAA